MEHLRYPLDKINRYAPIAASRFEKLVPIERYGRQFRNVSLTQTALSSRPEAKSKILRSKLLTPLSQKVFQRTPSLAGIVFRLCSSGVSFLSTHRNVHPDF